MFGACDRSAETTPEPAPLPDTVPSSAPPEVQRIAPTAREDPWTRGAHPAAPIHPTQTMRREPHAARVMSPPEPPAARNDAAHAPPARLSMSAPNPPRR